MKKRKKKDEEASGAAMFSEAPVSTPRITPEDIQHKEFGVARMGGYRHHEVDEFLDDLTRAMGELIQENERLRHDAPSTPTTSPAVTQSSGPAMIQPFLERERDFLRSLGELVQAHMDQVRTMARSIPARDEEAPSSPSTSTSTIPSSQGSGAADESATEPDHAAQPPAASAGTELGPAPVSRAVPPPTEQIHVGEAQPAAAARGDEGGLRELFWGEDE